MKSITIQNNFDGTVIGKIDLSEKMEQMIKLQKADCCITFGYVEKKDGQIDIITAALIPSGAIPKEWRSK